MNINQLPAADFKPQNYPIALIRAHAISSSVWATALKIIALGSLIIPILSWIWASRQRTQAAALPPRQFPVGELQLFQKAKLNLEEAYAIDRYIQTNLAAWSSLATSSLLRLPKEQTGLARTIHVFFHENRLHVMVLCKTHNELPKIGQGNDKKVTRALLWEGGIGKELWAHSVNKGAHSSRERTKQGALFHQQIHHVPGILGPLVGAMEYVDKHGQTKFGFFTPRRERTIPSKVTAFAAWLNLQEKIAMTRQLLQSLCALEQINVTHNDIWTRNFLLSKTAEGIRVELFDFDWAQQSKENLAILRQTRPKGNVWDAENRCFIDADIAGVHGILKQLWHDSNSNQDDISSINHFLHTLATKPLSAAGYLQAFNAVRF